METSFHGLGPAFGFFFLELSVRALSSFIDAITEVFYLGFGAVIHVRIPWNEQLNRMG